MTLARMHKLLGALVEKGYGRREVVINKNTLKHNLEGDGYCMFAVNKVRTDTYYILDGDGAVALNQDGSERIRFAIVIEGDA